jgi:hypothetical protein
MMTGTKLHTPVISNADRQGELAPPAQREETCTMRTIRWRASRGGVMLAVAALVAGSGLLATTAFSATSAAQTPGCAPDTTVQTTNGPVCGIVDNGVSEWLGIPCPGRARSKQPTSAVNASSRAARGARTACT